MTTAEEWTHLFAIVQFNDPAVHGQMLPAPQTIAFFKQIQLDAYKAGMSEAATIAENTISEESLWIHLKIRKARDAKATL